MTRRVAIIGGGAAGLAAAAEASSHGAQVVVYEASDRVGRPVLATGNGRCNFSNAHIDTARYHNAEYAASALGSFEGLFPRGTHPNGVVAFFARHGMLYREEAEGRLYPSANKASVVVDVLRAACAAHGAKEKTSSRVAVIEPPRDGGRPFTLRMADGAFERADAAILACGGRVAAGLVDARIPFEGTTPVLCSLATDTAYVRELDNIRAKASVALVHDGAVIGHESGEVMFRKYGVSGICVFNLSRFAQSGDHLWIDLLPMVEDPAGFATRRLAELASAFGVVTCESFCRGLVLPRIAETVLKSAGLLEGTQCSKDLACRIVEQLKRFELEVQGPGDVEHAQVGRGGFDPYAFDASTMESLAVPGLHIVGEALDVDGPCGGYNLHWAFATGLLAGRAAAQA